MFRIFPLTMVLLMIVTSIKSQYKINEFNSKINFNTLDSVDWVLTSNQLPSSNSRGVLMFKHIPIIDSLERPIEPVIAILYESIIDSINVIEYSISLLGQKPYKLKYELLGGYPDYSSDKYSVIFKGEYLREDVKHLVLLGYILSENIGIEIIGDATEEIFPKVESDINYFLKSVNIKK